MTRHEKLRSRNDSNRQFSNGGVNTICECVFLFTMISSAGFSCFSQEIMLQYSFLSFWWLFLFIFEYLDCSMRDCGSLHIGILDRRPDTDAEIEDVVESESEFLKENTFTTPDK